MVLAGGMLRSSENESGFTFPEFLAGGVGELEGGRTKKRTMGMSFVSSHQNLYGFFGENSTTQPI